MSVSLFLPANPMIQTAKMLLKKLHNPNTTRALYNPLHPIKKMPNPLFPNQSPCRLPFAAIPTPVPTPILFFFLPAITTTVTYVSATKAATMP